MGSNIDDRIGVKKNMIENLEPDTEVGDLGPISGRRITLDDLLPEFQDLIRKGLAWEKLNTLLNSSWDKWPFKYQHNPLEKNEIKELMFKLEKEII